MNYQEALDWMFSRVPNYQAQGQSAINNKLEAIAGFSQMMGNPQDEIPTIHIAGTNGKGSSSHMLSAIFQHAGYKVGLYTSPHLIDFRERIKINGQWIAEHKVLDFLGRYTQTILEFKLSFFELTYAMAVHHFHQERVDVAIIETGLGGRLDASNIVKKPLACLITNISLDHQAFLGNNLASIATEKAGIIKNHCPVIISEYHAETWPIFEQKASATNSPIIRGWENTKHFPCDLEGTYQKKNLNGVVALVEAVSCFFPELSLPKAFGGLEQVQKLTGFQGRMQQISSKPNVYLDTAHNPAGIASMLEFFSSASLSSLHFVLGMVADKNHEEVLALLPKNGRYYFCQSSNSRSLPADQLQKKAKKAGLEGKIFPSPNEALIEAQNTANKSDTIIVFGSNFVIADILTKKD